MSYANQKKSSGFSLIELLITLGILVITLTIALPGFREFFDRERLINATEEVYGMLQKARMESMSRSDEMYVNFASDSGSWSYGLREGTPCDPSIEDPALASACVIEVVNGDTVVDVNDKVLMRQTNEPHPDIALSSTITNFEFDPIRGTATAGEITLTSAMDKKLQVKVMPLGNISVCSPDGQVPSYRDC
jgi:prepilin-type N-terminal cleavage/methylation domain-containing protein